MNHLVIWNIKLGCVDFLKKYSDQLFYFLMKLKTAYVFRLFDLPPSSSRSNSRKYSRTSMQLVKLIKSHKIMSLYCILSMYDQWFIYMDTRKFWLHYDIRKKKIIDHKFNSLFAYYYFYINCMLHIKGCTSVFACLHHLLKETAEGEF